jgi:hypothetical protein
VAKTQSRALDAAHLPILLVVRRAGCCRPPFQHTITQLLSAPEGPSRVARDASPWFVTWINIKPRRGDINLVAECLMSPLRGCALVGDSAQALTDLATRCRPCGAAHQKLNSSHASTCIIVFQCGLAVLADDFFLTVSRLILR